MANKVTTVFESKEVGLDKVLAALDESDDRAQAVAAAMSGIADAIAAELPRAKAAVDALGAALGPELLAKLEASGSGAADVAAKFQALGLTFEDIEANADDLAASVQKLDAVAVEIDGVRNAAGPAADEVDKLSRSGRGANQALGNMVGNSAQDIAQLGGVAATAGVAIGQMAEYATDAALGGEKLSSALGSMVKVAGPVAALSLAVKAIADAQAFAAETAKVAADNQSRWNKALRDGGPAVKFFVDELRDVGELQVDLTKLDGAIKDLSRLEEPIGLRSFFSSFDGDRKATMDIIPILAKYGITVNDVIRAAAGGQEAQERFREGVKAVVDDGDDAILILSGLTQQIEAYTVAQEKASRFRAVFEPANAEMAKSGRTAIDYERALTGLGEAFQENQRIIAAHAEELKNSGRRAADYEQALTNMGEAFQRDVTEKAEAAEDALADLNTEYERNAAAVWGAIDAQDAYEDAQHDVARAARELADAQADQNKLLTEGKVPAAQKARALGDIDTAQRRLGDATDRLNQAYAAQDQLLRDSIPTDRDKAEALQAIADAQYNLEGAMLSEREAALNVADAQDRLADARKRVKELANAHTGARGERTDEDRDRSVDAARDVERAELGLARAKLRTFQAARDVTEATEDANDAQSANQRLLSQGKATDADKARAAKAVADAQRDVQQATRDVTEAQAANRQLLADSIPTDDDKEAATRRVEDATNDLEEAIKNQTKAFSDVKGAAENSTLAFALQLEEIDRLIGKHQELRGELAQTREALLDASGGLTSQAPNYAIPSGPWPGAGGGVTLNIEPGAIVIHGLNSFDAGSQVVGALTQWVRGNGRGELRRLIGLE